jgi:hypothetical protein
MNIVLASIFRNSSSYLDRYFSQITELRRRLAERGHTLRFAWAEGDSEDDTFQRLAVHLNGMDKRSMLIQVNHGGPMFGSIDNDQRWRNISKVCNELLGLIDWQDDFVVYIESDLLWTAETILALLDHVQYFGIDAVAPMCFHLPTGTFYDTWGHRKNGVRFDAHSPYHQELQPGMSLTPIDSAGSCIVMRGVVAQQARFDPPELGIVGFGNTIRKLGFHLWLDPGQRVFHP